nr:glycosyltransferase [Saprospiraceae bacterium]
MKAGNSKRRVVFHRFFNTYYGGTNGGPIKVRDCFEHIRHSEQFRPVVYFDPKTQWFDNPGNVWLPYRNSEDRIREWKLSNSDILFFSGSDWNILSPEEREAPPVPILNIAHPRHTQSEDKRNAFLQHPAIRITKSSLSKKILEEHGVNGPVYFIPDAVDPSHIPAPNPNPDLDLLIVGLKNPQLAKKIYRRLKWKSWLGKKKIRVEIQTPPKLPTRQDFLRLANRAKTVVYLPLEEKFGAEGFYLPALEGMFMEKLVICPFAIGNVDFCIPDQTCIMPDYEFGSIMNAINRALNMPVEKKKRIIENAKSITSNHLIEKERESLLKLLNETDDIWNQRNLFRFKQR